MSRRPGVFPAAALAAASALSVATEPERSPPAPAGPTVRLTRDGLDKQRPCWSPDGTLLLFARHESGGMQIRQYVMTPGDPGRPRRLTPRDAPEYDGAFSPDGRRVLFVAVSQSGTQGNLDIAEVPAEGGTVRKVVGDHGGLSHQEWPSWSPDGRRFAFSSTHEGDQEVYTAAADGSGLVRVTRSPGLDAHPCWSPDGRSIVFATERWGGLELARARPDGTGLSRLTTSPGLDDYPTVSPDGARIAFVSHRDGQFEVYVCGADGSRPVNVSRHPSRDSYPCWTPDGRAVTFVSHRDGGSDLYSARLDP